MPYHTASEYDPMQRGLGPASTYQPRGFDLGVAFDPGEIILPPMYEEQIEEQEQVPVPDELGFLQGLPGFTYALARQVPSIITDVIPDIIYRAYRRGDIGLENVTMLDRLIAENQAERERVKTMTPEERERDWFTVPFTDIKVKMGQAEETADSIGYSLANMAAILGGRLVGSGIGMLTGPAAPFASPVLRFTLGAAAGIATTQGATKDQFVEMVRDEFLRQKAPDGKITPELQEQWNNLREEINTDANWYGFWEAAPETAGNMLMFGIGKLPIKKGAQKLFLNKLKDTTANRIGKEIALKLGVPTSKLALMLTEESLTEAVTQKKQADLEYKLGMRDAPISYSDALAEVLPMVLTTTPVLGGVVGVPSSIAAKRAEGKAIGEAEAEAEKLIERRMEQLVKNLNLPAEEEEAALENVRLSTGDYIPLLTIFIFNQCDKCRSVRIILD